MTKFNKKCVDCKQIIEQVFCKFDYNCEHERIQAKERRATNFPGKNIKASQKIKVLVSVRGMATYQLFPLLFFRG